MLIPTFTGRSAVRSDTMAFAVTAAVGVIVGSQLHLLPYVAPKTLLSLVPLALVVGILFRMHPRWTVVAIGAISLTGLYRISLPVGPIELRILDLPYAALVLWALVHRAREGPRLRRSVGQPQVALLVAVLGISLIPALAQSPGGSVAAAVSWFRFAQTMSLVWLTPFAVRDDSDRRQVVNAMCLVATGVVAHAIALLVVRNSGFTLGNRLDGTLGPNATGLVAAVVVVMALMHQNLPRRVRLVMGGIGVVGVVLSQSLGAMAALGIALAVAGLRAGRRDRRKDALVRPARALVLTAVLFLVVSVVKPTNLPTSRNFETSSTAHRTILGLAGLKLFAANPVLGVGWQRSALPEVIGDPTISDQLREQFTEANRVFFPDQNASSVHNAYIQVLAEAGIPGLLALAFTALAIGRGLRRLSRDPDVDEVLVRVLAVSFVVVVLWWNDNALFGAQPETVLAALLLGLLASFTPVRSGSKVERTEALAAA